MPVLPATPEAERRANAPHALVAGTVRCGRCNGKLAEAHGAVTIGGGPLVIRCHRCKTDNSLGRVGRPLA